MGGRYADGKILLCCRGDKPNGVITVSMSSRANFYAFWASVPVIITGLLLATIAVFKAPWPGDPELAAMGQQSVSHADRMRGEPHVVELEQKKTIAWYYRRLLDRLIYDVLAMAYACVLLSLWRRDRRIPLLLTALGGIGVLYSSFIGLYLGPILAVSGFSLVLFGAGLSWASQQRRMITRTG